jgi:hypothetical protein
MEKIVMRNEMRNACGGWVLKYVSYLLLPTIIIYLIPPPSLLNNFSPPPPPPPPPLLPAPNTSVHPSAPTITK